MGPVPPGDPLKLKRLRRDEEGQLLLLAGVVLTISFILTALTLSQVASLEKEAAQESPSPILGEWRFLHERLASNVRTGTEPTTTLQSFRTGVLPNIGATFRALAAEKGYDFVIRLASGDNFAGNGNEASLLNTGRTHYAATSYDGTIYFDDPADSDTEDGLIWLQPCPDPAGPAAGCIGGVILYLRMTDGTATIEESVLFAANQ